MFLEKAILFFSKRHLLTNLLLVIVLIGGVFAWHVTNKEEMPAVTFDTVHVSVTYPGAPAADVEYFVARPLEEMLRGLDGVYRLQTTCSVGQASIRVELESGYPNVDEAVTEIRNTVLDVDLPDEVIDDPKVRVFKTTKKAILDIALYHSDATILDDRTRKELQSYAFALENRLLALPEVHSINKSGYLREEIQIEAHPDRLTKFEVPFNTLMREIRGNNIRRPAGTIAAEGEPKVTLLSELKSAKDLNSLVVQGGFDGRAIRLGEAADVKEGYEKNDSVLKVNGHEAVIFNVVKNGSSGILEALDAVNKTIKEFRHSNLQDTPVRLVLLDDESIDVRNRLSLIGVNGAIGFVLILGTLFIFLNKRAGVWVAMGIPFTLSVTLIASTLLGYTVNGTTLAAVIIVMGIIVDDAIVVAENISRKLAEGLSPDRAVAEGTAYVFLPIVASIITTCVAFVPLFFFTGHFGKFIEHIPPIIFIMLGASLFESLFILPGHMGYGLRVAVGGLNGGGHWFTEVEKSYSRLLQRFLPYKGWIFLVLILVLVFSGWLSVAKMKFVMFPQEETRDIVLTGKALGSSTRYDTARKVGEIEEMIKPYIGKEVVGFRTMIAQSRRGGAVEENKFRLLVEIVPKAERDKSADTIISELEEKFKTVTGFEKLRFAKSRWGQSSGSPIELMIQENNDEKRRAVARALSDKMGKLPFLKNVEIDAGLFVSEYQISINREKIKRLSINPADIASTLRAALEGVVLYDFSNGDEEVRVRLTTTDAAKKDIETVLSIPVENNRNYLVPLRDLVDVKKVDSPNSISRRDMKRTTMMDADLQENAAVTPLDAAEYLEEKVFPAILSRYPTTTLSFGGEVQDTRESKNDFRNATILALLLIYGILAVLFDSTYKPLFIMLAIPFGVAGIVMAFFLHGKLLFGFYAAVGALGLSGVVINDAIIMLVKLDDDFVQGASREDNDERIAVIASTRLRAVVLTTLTTVAGVLPTAYGFAGYDAMLAEMMLALSWGLLFGTVSTLVLVPCLYSFLRAVRPRVRVEEAGA